MGFLSKKQVEDLRQILKEEYQTDLSRDEAESFGEKLTSVFAQMGTSSLKKVRTPGTRSCTVQLTPKKAKTKTIL